MLHRFFHRFNPLDIAYPLLEPVDRGADPPERIDGFGGRDGVGESLSFARANSTPSSLSP